MDSKTKIHQLPSSELTPDTLLGMVTEQIEGIKSVAILVLLDDDTVQASWSRVSMSDLCYMVRLFQLDVDKEINKPTEIS